MNYFERLNYAFSYSQFKNLSTSARITYITIIYKWNAFRQSTGFSLSDRELQSLTGLSSNAVTAAKRTLKNLGLIDFKSTKAGTLYFLPQGENARFNTSSNAQADANFAKSAKFTTSSNNKNINKLNQNTREGGKLSDTFSF